MPEIYQSITIGYFCAAIGGVVTIALAYDLVRTRWMRCILPVAALLLLIHPAWTVSASMGDCGYTKREFSCVFTTIYFGLLIYQDVVSKRAA